MLAIFFLIINIIIIYFVSQSVSVGKPSFVLRKEGYLFYNLVCVCLVYSFFGIFISFHHILVLITITLSYVLSLVMYYIHEFRGTNISFSDILSLNTAKEVAGGYEYKIKPIFVVCLLFVIEEYIRRIAILRQIGFFYERSGILTRNRWNDLIFTVRFNFVPAIIFVLSFIILRKKISKSKYDYSLFAGENEGYLYNFFSSIPIFHKLNKKDEGRLSNCEEAGAELSLNIANLGKIDNEIDREKLPHVIVVMNESFGIAHTRVNTNISVTPYYDSLKGLAKGNLYVNTFGGGTANTEFEFLTGMSIGNYPYPVMPYNNFVDGDKYSLARYFKGLNYETIAMHPYTATNYHRDKVYRRFGFDELLFYNEFTYRDTVRNFVTDEAFYKEVIHQYKMRKDSGKKLFMFGITMQNHSGYQKFDGMEVSAEMGEVEGKLSLDSYLSLMKKSDEALKTLMDYFEKAEEHVVILFFGDHNASFGTEINRTIYEEKINYECLVQYKTPFFIYDNRDKTDEYVEAISANFLSLELIKKAQLPYDRFHKFLEEVYGKYSVYNYHKRKERAGGKLDYISYDSYMKIEEEYLKK